MLAKYLKLDYSNSQHYAIRWAQRMHSLTLFDVQKEEGGKEATAVLRGLLCLLRHQHGTFFSI